MGKEAGLDGGKERDGGAIVSGGSAAARMTLVDGLRAVAALVVVLPHAWVLFEAAAARSPRVDALLFLIRIHGTRGVQVFFVLSGFVIAYTMRHARVTPGYFGRFVLRRSIRLDPPYWLALAICCGVLWIGRDVAHDGSRLPTPTQLLTHLPYLQQFFGCNYTINQTYWTLCQEVQMYLAFCGAIGLLQAARVPYRPALTLACAVALAWPLDWHGPGRWGWVIGWTLPGLFLTHAYAFLAGAVVWWTVEGTVPRWASLAVVGVAIVGVAQHGDGPVLVVSLTSVLLAVAGRRGTLHRWLDHRPLQAMGRASYGLYLLHNPVILLVLMVQRRMGWVRLGDGLCLLVVVFALSVAGAAAMHRWVERPCLAAARRFRSTAGEGALVPA